MNKREVAELYLGICLGVVGLLGIYLVGRYASEGCISAAVVVLFLALVAPLVNRAGGEK